MTAWEPQGSRFDRRLLLFPCCSVIEQDTEPLTTLNEKAGALPSSSECEWVNVRHVMHAKRSGLRCQRNAFISVGLHDVI